MATASDVTPVRLREFFCFCGICVCIGLSLQVVFFAAHFTQLRLAGDIKSLRAHPQPSL